MGKKKRLLLALALDAIAPFVGSFVGLYAAPSSSSIAALLAAFSGFFIFLALSELLPQAHMGGMSRRKSFALTLAGVVAVYLIRSIAPI